MCAIVSSEISILSLCLRVFSSQFHRLSHYHFHARCARTNGSGLPLIQMAMMTHRNHTSSTSSPCHTYIHTSIFPFRSPSRRSPRFCALVCVHIDLLGFDSRAEVDNGVCVCVAQECPSFIIMCWISEAVQTKDKRVQESRKWNEI